MIPVLLTLASLVACEPTPAPAPPAPPPAPTTRELRVPPLVLPLPPPPPPGAPPSPAAIAAEGEQLTAAARRYTAWGESKSTTIDRLAILSASVTRDVGVMQAHRTGKKYDPEDVKAAQKSVDDLRDYLANKDD